MQAQTLFITNRSCMEQNNPLIKYYRSPKFIVRLPSQGAYYKENDVVDLSQGQELSILPMTAQDEIMMKNPDALLNGDAISSVIRSCVPTVKKPKRLLSCDVDALLIGIRAASYGESSEISANCPECSAENAYGVNFESLLESSETLESTYEVVLSSGVTINVSPSTFETVIKQQRAFFEGTKIEKILQDVNMPDENRLKLFSESFTKLSKLNFELMIDSIVSAVVTDDDGQVQTITDRKIISDFIRNIENADVDRIEKMIRDVNSHGVKKQLDATCKNCGHTWEVPVEFNDSNFF